MGEMIKVARGRPAAGRRPGGAGSAAGDLADARSAGLLSVGSVKLAVGIVVALVEQALSLFSTSRIDATAIPDIVRAVLRAMGCPSGDAAKRTDEAALNADAFAQRTSAATGIAL
ncbi:hypothetical protein ACVITL_006738 [Rhizobium pisi]